MGIMAEMFDAEQVDTMGESGCRYVDNAVCFCNICNLNRFTMPCHTYFPFIHSFPWSLDRQICWPTSEKKPLLLFLSTMN